MVIQVCPRAEIYEWVRCFKNGRELATDDKGHGRPVTKTTSDVIGVVKKFCRWIGD